jgi:hypothetical protein
VKKSIWLSYDLGVKGDYEALYAYLDNQEAVECGNGIAYFSVDFSGNDQDLAQKIKSDIQSSVNLSKTDRIYIVYPRKDQKVGGKFIVGKRKASPWKGYGPQEVEEDVI